MARHDVYPVFRHAAAGLVAHEFLALYPSLALALLWFGPRGAVIVALAGIPLALVVQRRIKRFDPARTSAGPAVTVSPASSVIAALDHAYDLHAATGKASACIVIGLDDATKLVETYGQDAFDRTVAKAADRIAGMLRDDDTAARIDATRFAIALAPERRVDLEAVIQIAGRLRAALAEPFSIDAATVYISASAGFCLMNRAPEPMGASALAAAERAQEEARRNGPGGLRAYSPDMGRAATEQNALRDEVAAALENGEIVAYFQPQLSTDTGEVSGFETLARWQHPRRGTLTPAEFLPALIAAGLGARLGEVILGQALSALRGWDRAGLRVPRVAVNFSSVELRDPNLAAKIRWELDRFDLEPQRLTVEILESVVADSDDDMVVRNIAALAKAGCAIDLDDFGTGHASLSAIRRFSVGRIKIDRSYVSRVDTDLSQQRMVAAILSMAERLGIQTLAEGVETIGEHAHLAQLGCTHVQGFVIARPMPVQRTEDWLRTHLAKLAATPGVTRRTG